MESKKLKITDDLISKKPQVTFGCNICQIFPCLLLLIYLTTIFFLHLFEMPLVLYGKLPNILWFVSRLISSEF